jgi:ABC-type uncharacterized transport system ATPase subunit
VLELDGLTRRYGDVVALDGLTFAVAPGQVFGFVGPNGAGKTTAMRIVLGVLTPDAGVVRWDGRPIDEDLRARFGYMPEERGLYPKMRVGEQLAYFARLHGADDATAQGAAQGLWRVEVQGAAPGWARALPGVDVRAENGSLTLAVAPDEQALLDAARSAGRVTRFEPAAPTLAELFREAIGA